MPEENTAPVPDFVGPDSDREVILKPGDNGNAVLTVQRKLQDLGFNPGPPDGDYGPLTRQAMIDFQRVAGLPETGCVDPQTLHALGYEVGSGIPTAPSSPLSLQGLSFPAIRAIFPEAPAHHIQQYLPEIMKALAEFRLDDKPMVLMALATIRAETAGFAPISEYVSQYNTAPGGPPYALYDFRNDLGNNAPGDGDRYKGRGFIQLTGKYNYQRYSQILGLGDLLIQDPEKANDPGIAARLLAAFLKHKEPVIRQALAQNNFAEARRAVNGGTHGFQSFVTAYQTGEQVLTQKPSEKFLT